MSILKARNKKFDKVDVYTKNIARFTATMNPDEDGKRICEILVWFHDDAFGKNGYLKNIKFETLAEGNLFVGILTQIRYHADLTQELVNDLAGMLKLHSEELRDQDRKISEILSGTLSLMGDL